MTGDVPLKCMNCMTFYRTLGRFLSIESQNQVCLLLEVGGRGKCNVNLVKWIKTGSTLWLAVFYLQL
ncbi:hypothetical protein ABFA07_004866 [Porites harrisoni]